jgi:hypothetical protein
MAECIYTLGGQGDGNGSATSVLAGNVCQDQYIYSNWGTIAHDEDSSYWRDYDNLIRWSGQDWMYYDQPTVNNITVGPTNYSDNATYRAVVPNNTSFTQATIVPDGQWPAAAQAIITSAGPPSQVAPLTGTLDDTCLCADYTGNSWTWSGDRGFGDYENAVHQASSNGDGFSVQFTGTGISWIGEKSSGEGTAEVYVDGTDKGSVNAASSSTQAQQTLYSISGLTNGTHSLKVVKTGAAPCKSTRSTSPAQPSSPAAAPAVGAVRVPIRRATTPWPSPPTAPPPASGCRSSSPTAPGSSRTRTAACASMSTPTAATRASNWTNGPARTPPAPTRTSSPERCRAPSSRRGVYSVFSSLPEPEWDRSAMEPADPVHRDVDHRADDAR